jgi:hypothetical protein
MAAVQQCGGALKYVENQTAEICMAAVQQCGDALKYVENQTAEICMAAIQQDGSSCKYIKYQLFDRDEYIYMIYVAIFKSRIFTNPLVDDSIENRIDYLREYCSHITDELINKIIAINSRSTKRAI